MKKSDSLCRRSGKYLQKVAEKHGAESELTCEVHLIAMRQQKTVCR